MIKEIPINDILQHPQNPRKELGDLTELTDSIRALGIMQNLTVVENENKEKPYTVVIGHRRLAAAKEAGLNTVPCQVVEMDEASQVETMLMENMQREDLTPLEEAEGFQMMLDFGKSIDEICEKTGLSRTKVRHRIKLNELDKETLKQKMDKQIGMADLIKLEAIKDIETRNKVLEAIGTNNFDYELKRALDAQRLAEITQKVVIELNAEIVETGYWRLQRFCTLWANDTDEEVEKKISELKGMNKDFKVHTGHDVGIMAEREQEEPKEENKEFAELLNKIRAKCDDLKALNKGAEQRIYTFVSEIKEQDLRLHINDILKYVLLKHGSLYNLDDNQEKQSVKELLETYSVERLMLAYIIDMLWFTDTLTWDNDFDSRSADTYKEVYELYEKLGFEVADTERAICDGTHELYQEIRELQQELHDKE